MYGSIQKTGPTSKLVGVSTAAIMMFVAGWAFTAGVVRDMVQRNEPTVMVLYDAPDIVDTPAPEFIEPEVALDVPIPEAPPLIPVPPEFVSDEPPVMVAAAEPEPAVTGPVGPTTVVGGSPDTRPRLRAGDKPVYPVASIRAQEQGVSGIEVCVGANGRVTSASLARSSGFARLDEAAMRWVRQARFTPGTISGSPSPMCGHEVYYEWNLRDV